MKVRYTVPSDQSRVGYSTNGSTTVFSVPFVFFETTDLQVILVNTTTAVETTLTLTTHYTVTGGSGSAGSLTTVATYASGYTLVIQREIPYTQEIDYEPNDGFPADVNEEGLDRGTMQVQQVRRRARQTPQLPATYDPESGDIGLPLPEAGMLLVGNTAEDGWENASISTITPSSLPIVLSSAASGDVLEFNGTNWVNGKVGVDGLTDGTVQGLTGPVFGAGLRPFSTSTVSSADYSAFPIIQALPSGKLGCLYYHGFNHGQADLAAVSASQAVGSAGDLTINGNEASGGEVLSVAGVKVGITSSANDAAVTFTIYGELPLGTSITDTVTGVNSNTVYSSLRFNKITRVASNNACSGNIRAGLAGVPGDVAIKTSTDGGYSWSAENVLFDGTTSGLYLYYGQSLGVTASGEFVAQAAKITLSNDAVNMVRRKTTNSGATWGDEEAVSYTGTAATGTMNVYGNGKLTPSGKMVFTGYTSTQVFILVSADEGLTYARTLIRSASPAATETSLEVLDERNWIVVHRVAAVQKMLQQTTTDGGATWSAGTELADIDGNLTDYAYVSPNLSQFTFGGNRYLLLLPFPRVATSGVYDYEASLVGYYGRADEVFADSTKWGLRQVIIDATTVPGVRLQGRSGYPSVAVNPITGHLICAYSEEDASDTRRNDVKTIAIEPAAYLTQAVGLLQAGSVRLGGGTERLDSYIKETAWTPTITGSTGGVANTYTLQSGYYFRIGDRVFLDFDVRVSGANTATGNLRLSGLPFAPKRNNSKAFVESSGHGAGLYPQYIAPVIVQTYADIKHITSTAFTSTTDASVGNNFRISGTVSYTTDG